MQKKLHIKKGDTVIVMAGSSKGSEGKVLEVVREKERAIVEGVNMVSKHTKPNAKHPQGGIIKQEAPIHISNVKVSEKSERTTKIVKEKKEVKKVRVSKKSNEKTD